MSEQPESTILDAEDTDLEPVTLQQLARLDAGGGLQRMEAAIDILTNVRKASIAVTSPEDWLLFKRPDGRVTAYLSDDGCYRIDAIWGISVIPSNGAPAFNFEEIKDGEDFAFVVTGDGHCKLTNASITGSEGVRRSDEDFVKEKKGIQKKIEVRKAAFANLHGGIVRKLTGLKGLALTELKAVWDAQGQNKSIDHCAQGRGFGSAAERAGIAKDEYGEPPACPKCGTKMRFFPGKEGREPFWGCSQYKTCGQKPITAKKVAPTVTQEVQKQTQQQQRESRDDSHEETKSDSSETLPQRKNRLIELLRSKDKIGESRRKELMKGITSAKELLDLVDIESAINE